jgi:hypothetical protein
MPETDGEVEEYRTEDNRFVLFVASWLAPLILPAATFDAFALSAVQTPGFLTKAF